MTATSAVNAIQYPDLTNVKDQAAQFATMNTNVDTSVVPRFANASARDAAITSPIEGQICYLTQEHLFSYYTGGEWILAGSDIVNRKNTSESITTASTASNADDALYFYAEANSAYVYMLNAYVTGPTTTDTLRHFWTTPSGASMTRGIINIGVGQNNRSSCTVAFAARSEISTFSAGTHSSAGISFPVIERGIVITGSTPGLVQWTWSKRTAYADTLTVGTGSYLDYRKIS